MTTVVCSVKWISDAETFHPQTGPFKIIPWHFHSCKCKCLLIHGDLKHVKKTQAVLIYAGLAIPSANYARLFLLFSFFIPLLILKIVLEFLPKVGKKVKKKKEVDETWIWDWTGEVLWARNLGNYLEFHCRGPRRRMMQAKRCWILTWDILKIISPPWV